MYDDTLTFRVTRKTAAEGDPADDAAPYRKAGHIWPAGGAALEFPARALTIRQLAAYAEDETPIMVEVRSKGGELAPYVLPDLSAGTFDTDYEAARLAAENAAVDEPED